METFTPQPVAVTPSAAEPHRFSETPRNFEECKAAIVPVNDVLAQIGGKWTMYIIIALANGPQRFSELKRKIEGVSQKMLTSTLRDLEKDGFISRKVTPSIPPASITNSPTWASNCANPSPSSPAGPTPTTPASPKPATASPPAKPRKNA